MKRILRDVSRLASSEPRADSCFRWVLCARLLSVWPARLLLLVGLALWLGGGLAGRARGAAITAFNYANFNAPADVAFFNAAGPVAGVAQLTPAVPGRNGSVIVSTAVALRDGFDTEFQFRILNPSGNLDADGVPGGDGFALVIQGQGPTATGPIVGYIPYTIPNAVALEFDTWRNSNLADPDGNHLSVQDVGPTPNGLAEFHHDRSLGWAAAGFNLSDGVVHTAHVRYRPGLLEVFLDGAATPTLSAPLDLSNIGGRSPLLADGSAWLAFAAGTGGAYEAHEILSWSFQSVVPVVNQSPVANAGGPYTLDQGHPLVLGGSGTDPDVGDSLSFAWDLNSDATFGDATGAAPTVTPTALAALGLGNGAHTIRLRVTDAAGSSATASATLTIRGAQTITFDLVADHVFGEAPFTIHATASSGLPVTFTSLTPSVVMVSGNTVTIIGAGTATIRASQAGDANWQPAPDVDLTFTVRNDYGLWAWGGGSSGQLGNGQIGDASVPSAVWGNSGWIGQQAVGVAAGGAHSLAVMDDGRAWAWGDGGAGQLGTGETVSSGIPVAVAIPTAWGGHQVVRVAAGRNHSLALLDDGSAWAWGDNSEGQLGNGQGGRFIQSNEPIAVSSPAGWSGRKVVSVTAGDLHSLAILDDGRVWAWGRGSGGQLGNGLTGNSPLPVAVSMPAEWDGHRVLGAAAGVDHSLAVLDDGSVWAWGLGLFGSLGNGQAAFSSVPVAVSPPAAWNGHRVVSVAAGNYHSVALLDDGSVWSWGLGASGQLGNGQSGDSYLPSAVSAPVEWNGHRVLRVTAGSDYSLAILDDGSLWGWGGGLLGQLGDGRSLNSLVPVLVSGPVAWSGKRITAFAAGAVHALAIVGEANVPPSFDLGPDVTVPPAAQGRFEVNEVTFADPGDDIWSIDINYGDGSPIEQFPSQPGVRAFSLLHYYAASGTYTVTVEVSDGWGTTTDTMQVAVQLNREPVAVDDTYTTDEDTVLVVASPGVLANDTDADADRLHRFTFAGVVVSADADFGSGERFTGSYLVDPNAVRFNGGESTLTWQYRNDSSRWEIYFPDRGYHYVAENAYLWVMVGNDIPVFGDRYLVHGASPVSVGTPLPSGRLFNAWQIDLWDPIAQGADLLSDDTVQPMGVHLAGAEYPNGRIVFRDGTQAQLRIEELVSPLTVVAVDGEAAAVNSEVTLPSGAILQVSNNGSFRYDPNGQFNHLAVGETATDSFTYLVSDPDGGSATATATITITGVNDPPVAKSQAVTTAEDAPVAITLTGTDAEGHALTYWVLSGADHGDFTIEPPNLVYTPHPNFNGTDVITFRVSDGPTYSAPASVTITVTPVNDLPTAQGQELWTYDNQPLAIQLVGHDVEPTPLNYRILHGPTQGLLSGSPPNVVYTPPFPFAGSDSFTFEVVDADGATASATVAITVLASDRPPVAVAGPDQSVVAGPNCQATVSVDGSASSDPDGDALSFTWQLFRDGAVIHTVAGSAAASWGLAHGTYEAVLTVTTDKNGTVVSRSDRLAIEVLASAPTLTALSPTGAYAGGPAFTLSVSGGCFLPGAVVHWNGVSRPTTVVGGSQLTASIPASDLQTGADITVATVQVVNGDGQVSNPLGFSIVAQTVGTADAAVSMPGETTRVSTAPTTPGEPGVSVTVQNNGSEPVSVLAATYDTKPVGETAFRVDNGAFVDVQIAGANANVAATVFFYYPSDVSGQMENRVKLRYFDGVKWIPVLSSGGLPPAKDTSDDLDGTVSGGRFTVVFDATSTPSIMELAGTVFGMIESEPQLGAITGPTSPVALGMAVSMTANFAVVGDPAAAWVRFLWDDGTESITAPTTATSATAMHRYSAPGVYGVTVQVMDAAGDVGEGRFDYVVIYDSNGGFVTGGGWIESAPGAYLYDLTLTGRATFGFNSKYLKGRSVPTGQTQFQFQAGDFQFHSTAYEWLVVSGAKAQYKGVGRVNGTGNFGFLLTATDGQLLGGGRTDRFRIKVWDRASGTVIYDNRRGASDDLDAAAPQDLGGGSIVIQKSR